MEHHSDIVPWQLVGAKTVAAPVDDHGALIFDEWLKLLSPRTKLVAVAQVSNSLGPINPVADIIREANARGIHVLVDGAQGIAHLPIAVRELDELGRASCRERVCQYV